MITDIETTVVYFSSLTDKYLNDFYNNIRTVLSEHNVDFRLLKNTKDYYCRDYMPVQFSKDKYVQFIFRPTSYFTKKEYPYLSNQLRIELENKLIKPHYSQLILDGGNVVKSKSKVIVTDKVYTDNRYQMTDVEILKELENLLEAEVIIIPALPNNDTGHADGMISFIDENRVLINELDFEEDERWQEKFLATLSKSNLSYEEIPVFDDEKGTAVGIYINFLQVGKLFLVPFFKHPKERNDEVLQMVAKFYPECIVRSVYSDELIVNGGVLNCASWNVLK